MKIKDSVFGSESEKRLFKALNSRWSDKLNIYPGLQFVKIIDVPGSELPYKERDFIYKTEVDITLCTKSDKPLMSIEFDGMGHGFNKLGEYIQIVQTKDPNRKRKLDLKLRLAEKVDYPFLVVSYDEKASVGQGTNLTILDGIIGKVLAERSFTSILDEMNFPDDDEKVTRIFDDAWEKAEDHSNHYDLIGTKAKEYESEASERGLVKGMNVTYSYLCDPTGDGRNVKTYQLRPYTVYLDEKDEKDERDRAFDNAIRVGCRVLIKTPKGEICETVFVRNLIMRSLGACSVPLDLSEDIAKLIAFKKLLDLS